MFYYSCNEWIHAYVDAMMVLVWTLKIERKQKWKSRSQGIRVLLYLTLKVNVFRMGCLYVISGKTLLYCISLKEILVHTKVYNISLLFKVWSNGPSTSLHHMLKPIFFILFLIWLVFCLVIFIYSILM